MNLTSDEIRSYESILEGKLRSLAEKEWRAECDKRVGANTCYIITTVKEPFLFVNGKRFYLSKDLVDILVEDPESKDEYVYTRRVAADWVYDNPGRCFAPKKIAR